MNKTGNNVYIKFILNYLLLNIILKFLTKIKNLCTFKVKFKLNLFLNCYHISGDANNLITMITIYIPI